MYVQLFVYNRKVDGAVCRLIQFLLSLRRKMIVKNKLNSIAIENRTYGYYVV